MQIVGAVALIDGRRILVQQREAHGHYGGLWEFPGGKQEEGERLVDALLREIKEELTLDVAVESLCPIAFSGGATARGEILLLLYAAMRWQGEAQPMSAAALQWVDADALDGLAMPPLDLPLIAPLQRYVHSLLHNG